MGGRKNMNKKILGIFIVTLLIATTFPVIGTTDEYNCNTGLVEIEQDFKF